MVCCLHRIKVPAVLVCSVYILYYLVSIYQVNAKYKLTDKCPDVGYFRNPDSCQTYFFCKSQGSEPEPRSCPENLEWKGPETDCGPPETVQCGGKQNPQEKKEEENMKSVYLYLTFDDGPNPGTPNTLDVLKKFGISATFFVIGQRVEGDSKAADSKMMVRMVEEGHVIGDHSYDHMKHNFDSAPPWNVYRGVKDDLQWFGQKNINAVNQSMIKAGLSTETINNIARTMLKIKRLPFTDNWRVGKIYQNCMCTSPKSSSRNSHALCDALAKNGANVFGWDVSWDLSGDGRYNIGVHELMRRIKNSRGKTPGKIVILSHDAVHKPGGEKDWAGELAKFIDQALKLGYQFKTLDNYLTD